MTKIANENKVMFGLVAQAPDAAMRRAMLGNLAALRGISLPEIEGLFSAFEEQNEKALRIARRKAILERLDKEAGGMTLESPNLREFVASVVKAKGSVTLNPDLTLSVDLPKSGGGGTGGGRVSNDHKQPYVDFGGVRVVGPITSWLDAAYNENEQSEIAEIWRPNGKRLSGSKLAAGLVAAGILTESPIPSEA